METSKEYIHAFWLNFLGNSPTWFKVTIVIFLGLNPLIYAFFGPYITSCLIVAEFIFTLSTALKCYPLQPGGLLVFQGVALNLTNVDLIRDEVFNNFPVILLLMFMVASIHFMRDLLLFIFTKLLLTVQSKLLMAFLFLLSSALLSAFLDALTVMAVLISATTGFLHIFDEIKQTQHISEDELQRFHQFLRGLLMHGAVGTALGGVCTLVGEPQNLLIAERTGWNFTEFFLRMSPITIPVFIAGVITCLILEKLKYVDYGSTLHESTLISLRQHYADNIDQTPEANAKIFVQAVAGALLVIALALHVAEIGLIGLAILVFQTAFNGIVHEPAIGKAFREALPFTALLVAFFAIVSIIHSQHLFAPVTEYVLNLDISTQPQALYLANAILSVVSDNVFVATIYINEISEALHNDIISESHFEKLAIAINTGTNIPSIATPNGQAAFLFLLTSSISSLLSLSYKRMIVLALPYTMVTGSVGFAMISIL